MVRRYAAGPRGNPSTLETHAMPQFYPEHTPHDLDDFTSGYLDAAEWLLPEPSDDDSGTITPRDKIRGWTRKAIAHAKRDCAAFQAANAADIAAFCEITGRGESSAGHDFWLTRNGHGAGFWDRDAGDVGERLSKASRACGGCDADPHRGWIYLG